MSRTYPTVTRRRVLAALIVLIGMPALCAQVLAEDMMLPYDGYLRLEGDRGPGERPRGACPNEAFWFDVLESRYPGSWRQ